MDTTMSEMPEELQLESGKWIRTDVLVDEMLVENEDVERDQMEQIVDELVEEGPAREMYLKETRYMQLTSYAAAMKFIAAGKASMAKEGAKQKLSGAAPDFW